MSSVSFDSLLRSLQFGKLEKPVKQHLKNVYGTMGLALLACAVGGYVHVFTSILSAGLLSTFGSLGLLMGLLFTAPTAANVAKRFAMLMGFSFLTGVSMGPHLDHVIRLDPTIVPTAFLATSLVFVCFSLCSLLCDDRKYLALGGTLMSGCTWLMMLSLMYMFTGSQMLFTIHVYLGLLVMCGFVLYDTQMIIEKRRLGNDDFISHALQVFMDFIGIFRRLLVILSDKKDNKRRRD